MNMYMAYDTNDDRLHIQRWFMGARASIDGRLTWDEAVKLDGRKQQVICRGTIGATTWYQMEDDRW